MDLLPSSTIGLRQPGQIGTVGELRGQVSLLVVTVKPDLLTHDPQRRAVPNLFPNKPRPPTFSESRRDRSEYPLAPVVAPVSRAPLARSERVLGGAK